MRMSKQCIIFSLLILSICYDESMAADSPCGDWEPYKDEKCIKIIDERLRTYDDAIKTCQQQENRSSLVSIRSLQEQEFFSNLLFKTHKLVDAVWIGAKYISNNFKWADDTDVSFTNWVEGSPSNTADKACIQMIPDGSSMGKWADEPCNKKHLVVCQKMQTWSLSRLQQTLLDIRKFLTDSLSEEKNERINSFSNVKKELEGTKKQLNNLQQNPVPIDFIYVQLPNQPDPKSLWPTVEWTEVSSDYAGNFFRVVGGNAASFGKIQSENSPRLTDVEQLHNAGWTENIQIKPNNEWSSCVYSGDTVKDRIYPTVHRFKVSGGEVRPRNQAMRIWKRTK